MNELTRFLYGSQKESELSAFKWWNAKRWEYTIRIVGCVLTAQALFFLVSYSLGGITTENLIRRVVGALVSGLFVTAIVNIIYFLWPIMEIVFFKKSSLAYRKSCFAFINFISLMLPVGAILLIFIVKA